MTEWREAFACLGRLTYFAVVVFIIVAAISLAGAQERQWPDTDTSRWYKSLMRPDMPALSCCGKADAWWADKVETGPNGELIAVITDDRPDEPLGRRHIQPGTRFVVPNEKIKFDQGNPTGHIIIFIGPSDNVICYVQNGGV